MIPISINKYSEQLPDTSFAAVLAAVTALVESSETQVNMLRARVVDLEVRATTAEMHSRAANTTIARMSADTSTAMSITSSLRSELYGAQQRISELERAVERLQLREAARKDQPSAACAPGPAPAAQSSVLD